ncbi:MAG: hypothetical protein M5U34_12360 [Chloroflexi bacterium]|nr:hypothetical protein [Chloroflexota bacterium]
MTFEVPPDSPYIGSGKLDGNGIPPNFFSDIHARKAMHYCFDYDTFIQEAQLGNGIRTNGPIIRDMLGYNEDGPYYEFDLRQMRRRTHPGLGRTTARGWLPFLQRL